MLFVYEKFDEWLKKEEVYFEKFKLYKKGLMYDFFIGKVWVNYF